MKYCPKCGTPTEDETHFCPICGYDFQTMESSKSNDESGSVKNPSKTRKWVCLSFFAVILIVTIILLAVFVPKLNSKFRIGVVEEISLGANKDDVREILGQPDISEKNRWGYCSSSLRSYVNKSRDISEAMEAALLRGDLEKAERLNRQYERLMNEVSSKKFSYIEIEFKEDAVVSVLFDKAYAIEPGFKKVQQDELKYTGGSSVLVLPYYEDYTQNSKGEQCALDCTVDEKLYDTGTNLSCTTYFTDGSYYCAHLEAFTTDENYIIWSDAYSDHKTYKPYNFPEITTLGRVSDSGVWQSNVKFKSITIPNSVTSIGNSAFKGCDGLTSITIPNNVIAIGSSAFEGCTGLKNVTLGTGVTSIGDYAFYECTGLTGELKIPNSISSIGKSAFYKCSGLKKVMIGTNATSIADDAFNDCTKLESISVAEQNQTYSSQDGILYNKTKTKIVLVPKAIKGDVTIPDSVTSIADDAFNDCTELESISVAEQNQTYSSQDGILYNKTKTQIVLVPRAIKGDITIPASITSIADLEFRDYEGLTGITIQNGVTSIGDYAFYGCTGLVEITIPKSIISIGKEAFDGCTGLISVIWHAGFCASSFSLIFKNCINLTNVTIGNGVTSIKSSAFEGCTGLKNVIIGNGVTSIESSAFKNCTGLTDVTIGSGVTSIGIDAFCGCSGLIGITIPNNVTSIGEAAFRGCTSLASVVWNAENCTKVSFSSQPIFRNCTNLTSVIFGQNVKIIPAYAFYECTGLTGELKIPNSVTLIGDYAFCGCIGLTDITIPDSVTSIGDSVFSGCTGLKRVVWNAENCIAAGSYDYLIFTGCTNLTSVIFGQNVKMIPAYAFCGCTNLTSITIPDSVTSIGEKAFDNTAYYNNPSNWDNGGVLYIGHYLIKAKNTIKGSYTISSGTRVIAGLAFIGCNRLTSITIPDSVTLIGNSAFYECTGLTGELKIPNSVLSIGSLAFYYCSHLASVTIGKCVTVIEDSAFRNCGGLKHITVEKGNPAYRSETDCLIEISTGTLILGCKNSVIPNGVKSIGNWAFSDCKDLTSIPIPNGVKSIGEYAFTGCSNLTSITFRGMVQEWQTIKKGTSWNSGTGDYTITCTDGTIKPDGTVTYF